MLPNATRRLCKRLIATTGALLLGLGLASGPALAQDGQGSSEADANNPLANVIAFNIQNYYLDAFRGLPSNASGNQTVLRYAQPLQFGDTNWLLRASLPFSSLPVGRNFNNVTGLGNIDLFLAYQFKTKPGISFGIGPQVVAPTRSDNRLDTGQWQLGLANVYFNGTSPKFQYGYLLIYRAGVGPASAGRTSPSTFAFQPFAFYQLGNGWYTGGAPIWTWDTNSGNYNVPLGLRLGKVVNFGKTTANFFVEPQFSVVSRGVGTPQFQLYAAINLQVR